MYPKTTMQDLCPAQCGSPPQPERRRMPGVPHCRRSNTAICGQLFHLHPVSGGVFKRFYHHYSGNVEVSFSSEVLSEIDCSS